MMNGGIQQPDALLGQLDSLADPTRLRLVWLLQSHELSVAELCDILQMPQSTVSRHLKVLVESGWAMNRRQATTNLYRVVPDDLDEPARKLWLLARDQTEAWLTVAQDRLRLAERLKQRREKSQLFFEGAADQWDKLRSELYGERFVVDAMLAMLPQDWVVADLGCGTGQTVCELAGYVKQVIGVDQSQQMLNAARQRAESLDNVQLKCGNLESIPIDDRACDAAVMLVVLTYVADPGAVLAEMSRILKKGGTAVVVDLMPHDREDFHRRMGQQWMGFEMQQVKKMMQQAGFEQVNCKALAPQANVTGPALMLARGIKS